MRVDYSDGTVSDYVDMGTFALSLGDGPSVTAYAADYSPDETSYDVVAEWSPPTGGDSSGVTGYQLQYCAYIARPWLDFASTG